MRYQEKDIKHETGQFWVLDTGSGYSVLKAGITHSTVDSAYPRTADGLSIAVDRCDYLGRKNAQ